MPSRRRDRDERRGPVVVAVDAGKTKFLVGVFDEALAEVERRRIAVTTAAHTVTALIAHLSLLFERYDVTAVGLSVFGPLVTDPDQGDYGAIIGSSEPRWSDVNLPSTLAGEFDTPVWFDFDVNSAVVAEARHGSPDFAYLSVGTGIGGAFHSPLSGGAQRPDPPQLGHMYVPREPDDRYPGSCRFHGDCLQGLASGRALFGRWRVDAHRLPPGHEAWDLEARYLARACANLLYSSPHHTVRVGSGISGVPGLIDRANRYLRDFTNGFPADRWRDSTGRDVIERAATAPDSSLIGAAVQAVGKIGRPFNT
ncbi:ROK family protein [Actinosynnema sp. NPDC023794]